MAAPPIARHTPLLAAAGLAAAVAGAPACERRAGPGDRAAAGPPAALSIAAASSLSGAIEEAAGAFRAGHEPVAVGLTFGASGTLFAQAVNGAPFDLLLSADAEYPRRLVERGLAAGSGARVYATGRLVVWAPASTGLALGERGAAALADPSVRRVAIANPLHAPYGRAAEGAIRALGLEETLRGRLVLGENVEQAAQFAASGAADAAFIPLSLALRPALRDRGETWTIPAEACPPVEHALVVLSGSKNPAAAEAFASFLLGPEGRGILARHGLTPPEP